MTVPTNMKAALAVLALAAGAEAMACTAPPAPAAMPDGKSAAKEAMLAKKKEIDRYKRLVEEYLACESNPLRVQNAQAELDRVANRFNAEVKAFKAANGG